MDRLADHIGGEGGGDAVEVGAYRRHRCGQDGGKHEADDAGRELMHDEVRHHFVGHRGRGGATELVVTVEGGADQHEG